MTADRDRSGDSQIEPEDKETRAPLPSPTGGDLIDPTEVIPVPGAMSPAEIDERAQVVEKLRKEHGTPRRETTDDSMKEP
jgi:hypothetical protein